MLFQVNLNLNYLQYCDVSSFEKDFVEHKDKWKMKKKENERQQNVFMDEILD